ncbi:MAG: protein translocase subunit SecD [Lentisphaeria bacterium]
MKKSLLWRAGIVLAVLIACTLSIFPLKDRDLLVVFEKMAQSRLEDYQGELKEAKSDLKVINAKLDDMSATEGDDYTELQDRKEGLLSEIKQYESYLDDYEQVMSEADQLLAKDAAVRSPYRALKMAAQGEAAKSAVALRNYVPVFGVPNASNNLVLNKVRSKAKAKLHLGLDLVGGTEFILGFEPGDLPDNRQPEDVRGQIIEIVRNRVDRLGVVEPEIKEVGPASISLKMPSVTEDNKAAVRRTIKQTAKLTFHLVHPQNQKKLAEYRENPEDFTIDPQYERSPRTMKIVEPDGRIHYQYFFLTRHPERIRGSDIKRAYPTQGQLGNYYVILEFNNDGAKAFGEITRENIERRLAIVLDGKVYSAPVIQTAITGGSARITGSFGPEEASRLATVISSGNLPVPIDIKSEFGTDPTLGQDSIRSGVTAALLGLLAVLTFMVVYYRIAGVIAVTALVANIIIILGVLGLSGATITLPGIAGIVLVIGMAVDANVLIFERIREEADNGKSIGNAVKAGYRRAFVTILDANLTTLITAFILLKVGTGPIRGFAVTLSWGVVASMFTALFLTRVIFDFLLHKGWLSKISMANLVKKPNFDFLKLKMPAFALSLILIVITLITTLVRGNDIFSIDFSGGTALIYQVQGNEIPTIGEVRALLASEGLSEAEPTYKYNAGTEGKLLEIALPGSTNENNAAIQILNEQLTQEFEGAEITYAQTTSVGEKIGGRFRMKALYAALSAAIAIIIYISFRFEFAYAVASITALIHDVLVATGVYLLCGRQLSLPVVAALLTIMGYSLNDTIVLFDRIREDLGLLKNKDYRDIINLSINQTLSRTLLTSLTTLFVVLILFLFGGGAINDFALVMLIGIIVGTYSSVFVAGTIIATWHKPASGHKE